MSESFQFIPRLSVLGAVGLIVGMTACAAQSSQDSQADSANGALPNEPPTIIENCGYTLEFNSPPERIALMETAPVTILEGLGVFDRVILRAGDFPEQYYELELYASIQEIPSLSGELDAAGHFTLSQEEIIAREPDLVLGLPDGTSREGLNEGGATVLEQEIYCPTFDEDASFDHVYAEIRRYGQIFAMVEQVETMVDELSQRVETAGEQAESEDRTAAVLYPSVGGGPLYAYGTASMAHAQLEVLGFENVFADSGERVFEVQAEELVGRNPDVLILLYQGEVTGVEETVTSLSGAETITAVQDEEILTHLFNFTEPATPLSVDGLELIAAYFQENRP